MMASSMDRLTELKIEMLGRAGFSYRYIHERVLAERPGELMEDDQKRSIARALKRRGIKLRLYRDGVTLFARATADHQLAEARQRAKTAKPRKRKLA